MTDVRFVEANLDGRDFVVGDLHGCLSQLEEELLKVNFDKTKDRLFSVGDLVDRGPDSMGVLRLLNEPWFFAVMGNHEEMMIEGTVSWSDDSRIWMANGGSWAKQLLIERDREYLQLVDKARQLPYVLVVKTKDGRKFNVMHAETSLTQTQLEAGNYEMRQKAMMTWGRSTIMYYNTMVEDDQIETTFVGHTPCDCIERVGKFVFIDTGSCFTADGGYLTLVKATDYLT